MTVTGPVAAADGLHGAFAVPLCDGPEVMGVLEFFHRECKGVTLEANIRIVLHNAELAARIASAAADAEWPR